MFLFGVKRPSQHYLGQLWASQFTYPHFHGTAKT